jgi:hypothetical protein
LAYIPPATNAPEFVGGTLDRLLCIGDCSLHWDVEVPAIVATDAEMVIGADGAPNIVYIGLDTEAISPPVQGQGEEYPVVAPVLRRVRRTAPDRWESDTVFDEPDVRLGTVAIDSDDRLHLLFHTDGEVHYAQEVCR